MKLKISRYKKKSLLIGLILLLLSFIGNNKNLKLFPVNKGTPTPTVRTENIYQNYKVKRVIDGDTIELDNDKIVRYIGIDTPEIHNPKKTIQCFGKEAMLKNKELVEGKIVRMEKDISETDRYGRLLRYIFLDNSISSKEAVFVNQYLVANGFAYMATFPPDVKYEKLFRTEQENARLNNLGLWKGCVAD